ncbi:uncharacterized protein LOC144637533 isoform X2 [Oculina patagonica]
MKSVTNRYSLLQVLAVFYGQAILWKIGLTSGISLEPPPVITAYNTSSSSINVTWGWNSSDYESRHNVSGYKLTYREHDLSFEVFNLVCTLNFTAELTELKVFTNYCIELTSFNNNSVSDRSQCLFVTTEEEPPNAPPQNFSAYNISSTGIRVTWDPLPPENRRGIILGYKITFQKFVNSRRRRSIEEPATVNADILSTDLVGLEKFTNYCMSAEAFNSKGSSNETNTTCISTDEDVPSSPPLNILAHNTSSTSVYVRWDAIPTEFIHGILLGYKVFYGKTSEPSSQGIVVSLKPDQLDFNLTSLEKFTEYCIQLVGFTRIGDGNKSECFNVTTDEDVPSGAPQFVVQSFYSPTAIKVTWDLLPASLSHGIILGYIIHVKQTGTDVTDPPEDLLEESVLVEDASQTSFMFGNLSILTKYQVQIAAYTSKGPGNFSDPVFAETCRCPKYFTSFKSPSSLDDGGPGGISDVIANVIIKSCGDCLTHGKTELLFTTVDDGESNLRFPIGVTSIRGSDYSKFVVVLEVPGVMILKRRDKSTQRFYEEVMTGSLLDTWPVISITLLIMYLAGVIVWFLDRKGNPGDLPTDFIKGAYEGFWWSFITMTTVGYGDRCPKSFPARAFSIVWLLASLVLFTFLMGAISSVLTVTVIRSRTTVVRSGENKAAAITDSPEAKLAMGSLSSKLKLTTTFPTVEKLAQSLKDGEVDYVLIDMYVPVKRKDLFNGSWFEIAALIEKEMFHGVVLQGDALTLASALEEMIANDNVQTKFLEDSGTEEPTEVETNESLFFDPSSPFFKQILYASLGVLGLFVVCGLLYQVFYYKRRTRPECWFKHDGT